MGSQTVPRKGQWSWSRLVREFGEEQAFVMLQYQSGLGEYDGNDTIDHPDPDHPDPEHEAGHLPARVTHITRMVPPAHLRPLVG